MATFHVPDDPFLKDADGAARFCRDLIKRMRKWKADYSPAVYWSARWAAHWAVRSRAFATLNAPTEMP